MGRYFAVTWDSMDAALEYSSWRFELGEFVDVDEAAFTPLLYCMFLFPEELVLNSWWLL
jgi:hypothetical protein